MLSSNKLYVSQKHFEQKHFQNQRHRNTDERSWRVRQQPGRNANDVIP